MALRSAALWASYPKRTRTNPVRRSIWTASLTILFCFAGPRAASSQSTLPSTFHVLADGFEADNLDKWTLAASGNSVRRVSRAARTGSSGLKVGVSQSKNYLISGPDSPARADEAYLSFWFNPFNVALNDPGTGGIPGRSVQIGTILGDSGRAMVNLRFRQVNDGFEAFLGWRDQDDATQWDFATGSFPLSSGWQKITIGFRKDGWVSCWLNDSNVRSVEGVTHYDLYGTDIQIGQITDNSMLAPSGEIHVDNVLFLVPRFTDLWVDRATGSDGYDGLTPGTAFASIARASDLAGAGTTVHILPGIYRGPLVPAQGGLAGEPVVYKAENGPGTVVIRGSESSSALQWTQLSSNTIGLPSGVDPSSIWWADLAAWNLTEPPRFVVAMDQTDRVENRLPLAREPDWSVPEPNKHSQLWWVADGGASVAACDPTSDPNRHCDDPSRSSTQMTDATTDATPGVEPGNLTSIGDVTGATVVARDARLGHFLFQRTIVNHDTTAGRITVDPACEMEGGSMTPGLGWGSQYFVEDHPTLIDSPGEWWYDETSRRLYLLPTEPSNPAQSNLEISRYQDGIRLSNRSHVELRDLDVELFSGILVDMWNRVWQKSSSNTISGCNLRYGDLGIRLTQFVEEGVYSAHTTHGINIEDNEISHLDYAALLVSSHWDDASNPDSWSRSGVYDVTLRGNSIHRVGFRPVPGIDSAHAVILRNPDQLTFEGNSIADVANNGVTIINSVVQSSASWNFSRNEIKTGQILVQDNLAERTCQLMADCGAFKVWGRAPDTHVFRDLLFYGNTARDTLGWSWPGQHRRVYTHGQIAGAGGSGFYMDNISGWHSYRNISYNNGLSGFQMNKTWRDGRVSFYNNVSANNLLGLRLAGLEEDTHVDVDTQIRNNIFINNEGYGVVLMDQDPLYNNTYFDSNLYFNNGWGSDYKKPGAMWILHDGPREFLQTVEAVRADTPFEDLGQAVNPRFSSYLVEDHDPFDGSRPEFRLTTPSAAVDAGTATLGASLSGVLDLFGIVDPPIDSAYDQGAVEGPAPCSDLSLQDQTLFQPEVFQACGTITLGPNLEIADSAQTSLYAGNRVVMASGVKIRAGAQFGATVGF